MSGSSALSKVLTDKIQDNEKLSRIFPDNPLYQRPLKGHPFDYEHLEDIEEGYQQTFVLLQTDLQTASHDIHSRREEQEDLHTGEPRVNLINLIEQFKGNSAKEEIEDLALHIFELCSEEDNKSISELRNFLMELPHDKENDFKRSRLIRILGQLGDNNSLEVFLDEISSFVKDKNTTEPSSSLISALANVRLLKIPEERKEDLVKQIQRSVKKSKVRDPQKEMSLIAGAILTFRAIGSLQNSANFLLRYLKDEDLRIVARSIDALSHIWRRGEKNNTDTLENYQEKISRNLRKTITANLQKVSENSVTDVENVIFRAMILLSQVKPISLFDLISPISKMGNRYVKTSLREAFSKYPSDILVGALIKLRKEKLSKFMSDFLSL